jgi:tetratricopeptide (TPR) repeat protein
VIALWVLAFQLWQPVDWRELLPLYEARATTEAGVRDVSLFLVREQQWALAEPWLRKLGEAEMLADCLAAMGRNDEAIAEYAKAPSARALARRTELTGDPQFLERAIARDRKPGYLNDLALLRKGSVQADALLREALALQEKALGPNHPEVGTTLNNLGSELLAKGKLLEAETVQRRSLRILEATLGPRHVRTGLSASNLGDILAAAGKPAGAFYEQAWMIFNAQLGPRHPWTEEAAAAVSAERKPRSSGSKN